MNGFLAIISVIPWLLWTSNLWANDAPVRSVGKAICPQEDAPVRMLSEEVTITIDNNVAQVSCRFTLLNEGPLDTVLVGFPRGLEKDLYDFRAWTSQGEFAIQEGMATPFYYEGYEGEEAPAIKWWKTFAIPFAGAGDTVRVWNSYWTLLSPVDNRALAEQRFIYILQTGALWKGKIEDAQVTIVLRNTHADQITKLSPEGYTRQGQQVRWRFRHFEPSADISIEIMQDVLYDRLTHGSELVAQDPDSAEGHFLLGTITSVRRNGLGRKQSLPSARQFPSIQRCGMRGGIWRSYCTFRETERVLVVSLRKSSMGIRSIDVKMRPFRSRSMPIFRILHRYF